jgi:hypothetical protein
MRSACPECSLKAKLFELNCINPLLHEYRVNNIKKPVPTSKKTVRAHYKDHLLILFKKTAVV